ncbi:MAG TPA: class I SAM-dependent methyltransferase [Chitinophagaceae bacterium]|nr:class I SAM-dependent methyltransferase [Chitinophagaceae bacterium]
MLACDISETMLQHVRENALAEQLNNISTIGSAAEELDVPAESFDAAICRLGLLLFLEPKKALMFVDQALKPGGKIAVMVFFHAGSKCNYG